MKLTISGFLLLIASLVFAQTNYLHYTVKDGLAQMQCLNLHQDTKGYLWIGTKGGVSRFDGISFKNYTIDDGLTQNFVNKIFEDSKGNIWLPARQGLQRISNDSITYYPYKGEGYLTEAYTVIDKHDNIWFAAISDDNTKKLIKFNNGIFTEISDITNTSSNYLLYDKEYDELYCRTYTQNKFGLLKIGTEPDTLISTVSMHSYRNINGKIYLTKILSRSKYVSYVIENKTLHPIDTFSSNQCIPVAVYRSGQLIYLETAHSHKRTNSLFVIEEGKKRYLAKDIYYILDVLTDKEENVWIASEKGLFKLVDFWNYGKESGMPEYVWSVVEDSNNRVWFAAFGNYHLHFLNGDSIVRHPQRQPARYFYFNARKFSDGSVVFPVSPNIIVLKDNIFTPRKFPLSGTGLCVFEDRINHTKYYGLTSGLVAEKPSGEIVIDSTFNRKQKGYILSMTQTRNNTVWYSTSRILGTLPQKKNEYELQEYGMHRAVCIEADSLGSIWIGADNGLFVFHNKKFYKIHHPELNVLIGSVKVIDDGHLVYGGRQGIGILDINECLKVIDTTPDKKTIDADFFVNYYDQSSGFRGEEVGQCGIFKDSQNRVWIPTNNNVVMFRATDLHRNYRPPDTHITGFSVSTDNINWIEQNDTVSRLHHTLRNVRFDFTGISLTAPQLVKYKYRLVGFSNSWSKPTKERYVYFTNLPAGKYRFELLASNSNGVWNEQAVVRRFRIVPAWWQTVWFKVIAVLLLMLLVGGATFAVMRSRQKALKIKQQVTELQLANVRSQIYPHFFFNSLSAMQSLFYRNDKDATMQYFSNLSHLVRAALMDSRKAEKSLHEELVFVENYLKLQKFRFAKRFDYSITKDNTIDYSLLIPPMLIQTHVENAVKHGLEPLKSGGMLQVSLEKINSKIEIGITDNGIGRKKSAEKKQRSTGFGLSIFRKAVAAFNEKHSHQIEYQMIDLHTDENIACGTKVRIKIK